MLIALPGLMATAILAFNIVIMVDANGEERVCYDTPPQMVPTCSEPMKSCIVEGVFIVCDPADG